ncbi:MAG: N-acetylmuramoyl-L-alanine amidase family protein [Candidatus Pacearchaeota archaeon]
MKKGWGIGYGMILGFVLIVSLVLLSSLALAQGLADQTTLPSEALQTLEAPPEFYENLPSAQYLYPSAGVDPWTQTSWKDEYCNKTGMDFLVLIEPTACSPAVVRSDLLEEQDVPVLCRMTGIKINPLIQVPYIKSTVCTIENKSSEIGFVNFLPARITLSYVNAPTSSQSRAGLEGVPTMNNLGYLWTQLKQQPVEGRMPESVTANVSCKITYDVARTYGITENQFVLPILSQDEWLTRYKEFGFWREKGYLRLQEISGTNRAKVSVYTNPRATPLKTVELREGETLQPRDEIPLPGFYCSAGVRLKLEKITTPTTRARALVNGIELLLDEDEQILDSGCWTDEIFASEGYGGTLTIRCPGEPSRVLTIKDYEASVEFVDSDGKKTQTVSVGSNLTINKVGENKFVYIGFIGKEYSQTGFSDFIILFYRGDKFGIIEDAERKKIVSKIHDYVKGKRGQTLDVTDMPETLWIAELQKMFEGQSYAKDLKFFVRKIGVNKKIPEIEVPFEILSVTGPEQVYYKQNVENIYKEAIEEWKNIAFAYSMKPAPEGSYYGIIAMRRAADLASSLHKKLDQAELLRELIDKYSTSEEPDVIAEVENAREELRRAIAGTGERNTQLSRPSGNYNIELISIEKPGFGTKEAQVELNGTKSTLTVDDTIDGWTVTDIDETSVRFQNLSNINETIAIGSWRYLDSTKVRVLNTVLKREAKVTVLPFEKNRSTVTNFSIAIGIEKRAIELSPQKTNELISKLNKTISTLESVKDKLGKIVTLWKKACFAGATTLWIKNFVTGLSGEAYARKIAMEPWAQLCSDPSYRQGIGVKSVSECYRVKEDEINKDITIVKSSLSRINKFISDIKKKEGVVTKGGLLGLSQNIDTTKFIQEVERNFPDELKGITITEEKELRRITDGEGRVELASGEKFANIGEVYKKYPNIDKIQIAKLLDNNISSTNLANHLTELHDSGRLFRDDVKDILLNLDLYKQCSSKTQNELSASALCRDTLKSTYGELKYASDQIQETTVLSAFSNIFGFNPTIARPKETQSTKAEVRIAEDNFINKFNFANFQPITKGERYSVISYLGVYYVAVVESAGGHKFTISRLYEVPKLPTSITEVITITKMYEGTEKSKKLSELGISDIEEVDPTLCNNNQIKQAATGEPAATIKFWESGAYQGFVAWMPLNTREGWYMATTSYSGLEGAMIAWKENADINTFWICNVGTDGLPNFDHSSGPKGDDCCTLVSLVTGTVPEISGCLTPECSSELVNRAKKCSAEAIKKFAAGNRKINTSCGDYSLGKPPAARPAAQCEDYMSPTDCRIMYNLCDPVMCPASRCDFGGRMPVENVIQSGVVGSILLCWPNFENGKGVLVPVCLTGVHAGLDSFIGILKSGRDCLQEQLKSGKTVGICDQIMSIYTCEFFWKQIDPFLKAGLPSLAESLTTRGGGEYALFSESWKQSLDAARYFTDYYGVQSFNAFKARSTGQIGTEICKKFASITYPTQAKFWDELSKPESPTQATAWFDEISLGTATSESHYKVFFYIWAGRDQGVYYSVFLRSPSQPGYYNVPEEYLVKDGFGYLSAGQYISMSPDFRAPSGYKEICIRLNDKEYCDFTKVSTSFAINELQNYYLKDQLMEEVTSAKECVSGTPTLLPTATLNIQSYVESSLEPQIYKRGVTRICSSNNPGTPIQQQERFKRIGYCDNKDIGCWLDMETVNQTISDLKFRKEVINESIGRDLTYTINEFNLSTPKDSHNAIVNIIPEVLAVGNEVNKFIEEVGDMGPDELKKTETKNKLGLRIDELDKKILPLINRIKEIRDKCARSEEKAMAWMEIAKLYDLRARLYAQPEVYKVKKAEEEAQLTTCTSLGGTWKEVCSKYERDARGEVGDKEKNLPENANKKCCVPFKKEKLDVLPVSFDAVSVTKCYGSTGGLYGSYLADQVIFTFKGYEKKLDVKAIAGGRVLKIEEVERLATGRGGKKKTVITIEHSATLYSRYEGDIKPLVEENGEVIEGDLIANLRGIDKSLVFGIYDKNPVGDPSAKGKNPFCYFSKDIQDKFYSQCKANIDECRKGSVPSVALKDAVIVIDAGHGGTDNGAHGDGINEDDINLAVAKKLKDLLRGKVKEVIMTRERDAAAPSRATLANEKNANLFISIHCNSADDTASKGTEVWINCVDCERSESYRFDSQGKNLKKCTTECKDTDEKYKLSKSFADIVLEKIIGEVGTNNLGVKAWDDPDSTYIKDANMPAVLIEMAFISNAEDRNKLQKNQSDFARAIYDAVAEYFGEAVIVPPSNCANLGPNDCTSMKNCWWDSKTSGGKCLKCPDKCEGNNVWPVGNWLGIDDLIFRTQNDCEQNTCNLECLWVEEKCQGVNNESVGKKVGELMKGVTVSMEELNRLESLINKNQNFLNQIYVKDWLQQINQLKGQLGPREIFLVSGINEQPFTSQNKLIEYKDNVLVCLVIKLKDKYYSTERFTFIDDNNLNSYSVEKYNQGDFHVRWYKIVPYYTPQYPQYPGDNQRYELPPFSGGKKDLLQYRQELLNTNTGCIEVDNEPGTYWYRAEVSFDGVTWYSSLGRPANSSDKAEYQKKYNEVDFKKYERGWDTLLEPDASEKFGISPKVHRISRKSNYSNTTCRAFGYNPSDNRCQFLSIVEAYKNVPFALGCVSCEYITPTAPTQCYSIHPAQDFTAIDCISLMMGSLYQITKRNYLWGKFEDFIKDNYVLLGRETPVDFDTLIGGGGLTFGKGKQVEPGDLLFMWTKEKGYTHTFIVYNDSGSKLGRFDEDDLVVYTSLWCPLDSDDLDVLKDKSRKRIYDGKLCYAPIGRYKDHSNKFTLVKINDLK